MHTWQLKSRQEAEENKDSAPSSLRELLNPTDAAPSSSPSIPVVLCGKTERIGRAVIEGLKPEYEVVHFVTTPASGALIIPALLAGRRAPAHADSSAIGSGDYARAPVAVVLGGAFDDAAVATLQTAVSEAAAQGSDSGGLRKVPWLRQDSSKPAPPMGPEYGKAMVVRVREALGRLGEEGKLDGAHGGDEWY